MPNKKIGWSYQLVIMAIIVYTWLAIKALVDGFGVTYKKFK